MNIKEKYIFPHQDFLLPKDTLSLSMTRKKKNSILKSFHVYLVTIPVRIRSDRRSKSKEIREDQANTRCKERERERYQSVLIASITWYRYLLRGSNNKTFVNEPVAIVSCRWRIEVEEEGTAGGFSAARIKLIKPDYLDGC